MKKLLKLSLIFCLAFFACQNENVGSEDISEQDVESFDVLTSTCAVTDADRCYLTGQPDSNFWWPSMESPKDYFNPDTYFGSYGGSELSFVEYPDGTAHISGTTSNSNPSLTCKVIVDVWLKDKKDWTAWSSPENGGEFKDESGPNCSNIKKENLNFYVIDPEKSTITSEGGDCYEEGTFDVIQRPDENDLNTPHYGLYVGPGGANFHGANPDAYGLSGWGWIVREDGTRWVMDFNFIMDCMSTGTDCDTAFAIGNDNDPYTCFIDDNVIKTKRWGWNIGPLAEGTIETYDVYAGAGKCDTSKGAFVGTVDVSYIDGDVNVTYNIIDGYELRETHVYAGNAKNPTDKKGKLTVAPGQYTIADDLSGEIYVIAHAVVCN